MEDLTFGEQVKIILGRKGMTIKELAEKIEERTQKKMSRQNLTQRLGRDNFQEQDMRMIANILGCPFHLSILSKETQNVSAMTEEIEAARAARMAAPTASELEKIELKRKQKAAEREQDMLQVEQLRLPDELLGVVAAESREDTDAADDMTVIEDTVRTAGTEDAEEVDMTIGELYEIHEELSELEESAKEGESAEVMKEELERPAEKKKKEKFRTGAIFLRKKGVPIAPVREETAQHVSADKNTDSAVSEQTGTSRTEAAGEEQDSAGTFRTKSVWTQPVRTKSSGTESSRTEQTGTKAVQEPADFEPVIKHEDAEEDLVKGDVNPYTGREFQSNSVRMHPSRIGYVQVYDRTMHKWTDMTEWAFLGYQERKKALLGKDYEPPIYLD